MAKLLLILASLCFALISLANSSASSSPAKKKISKPVRVSPKKIQQPAWFKKSSLGRSSMYWNVYGLWFDQIYSKPSGQLIHMKYIKNVNEFWSTYTTKDLDEVRRVDISIFRPGYEPDFAKFTRNENGYILSYKLSASMIINSSEDSSDAAAAVAALPSKVSRNEAKILKEIETESPLSGSFPHYHIFDSLITAAMDCEDKSEVPSDIIGFTIKKQFDYLFFQVFVGGNSFESGSTKLYISNLISSHCPGVVFKAPYKYQLSNYSFRILGVHSPRATAKLPLSPTSPSFSLSSPEVSPSKLKIVTEESEYNDDSDAFLSPTAPSDDFEAENEIELLNVSESPEGSCDIFESCASVNFDELASRSNNEKSVSIDDIIDDDEKEEELPELEKYSDNEDNMSDITAFITSPQENQVISDAAAPLSHPMSFAPRTLEEELLNQIFAAPFELFKKPLKDLLEHFEGVLAALEDKWLNS